MLVVVEIPARASPLEWNVHVAIVSVAIILISAAASIGVFKQTHKIIWTVLLA